MEKILEDAAFIWADPLLEQGLDGIFGTTWSVPAPNLVLGAQGGSQCSLHPFLLRVMLVSHKSGVFIPIRP